ncbi:hypothetical protein GCM10022243_14650 [Saccharothrix violaceirubra]|uniref:Ribosome-associated toxin RatA of RatAB toxin-antitoxin module n=1 Tax=Saccharothrix violaceirubra TaxID=413306 RepID=A0A7W7WXF4_9PSEU|nr:SRPBCC family protein [Saccharothrix violaceirubra]MBB4967340.1 ribosome-associated toxin RatA of RatAB toxin-antitoxin module [Saccharothrix violaceirubra]
MTTRTLRAEVPATAAEVVAFLERDTDFPTYAPDLVSVSGRGEWVLAFRGGTATWTQAVRRSADHPDRLEFLQIEGDFQRLMGSWTATDLPEGGSEVEYRVDYGTSVPHLAGAIDSAVGRVLVRTAHAIVTAIGGRARVTEGGEYVTDPLERLLRR